MAQGAQLTHIRLEPAPGPRETSRGVGYGLVAPLDPIGMIDVETWKRERLLCFVRRIDADGAIREGLLVHRPGGAHGATWAFDYELGDGDEESGFRFDTHAFVPGAYVSVRDADGETHTYRVAEVRPA